MESATSCSTEPLYVAFKKSPALLHKYWIYLGKLEQVDTSALVSWAGYGAAQRDYREGWPLLTVETEANGDSRSTYERGPSLVGLLGSWCQYKRFLSCLGCPIVGPVQNFFSSSHKLFQFICLHSPAGWAGSHAGSPVS